MVVDKISNCLVSHTLDLKHYVWDVPLLDLGAPTRNALATAAAAILKYINT